MLKFAGCSRSEGVFAVVDRTQNCESLVDAFELFFGFRITRRANPDDSVSREFGTCALMAAKSTGGGKFKIPFKASRSAIGIGGEPDRSAGDSSAKKFT